MNNSSARPSWKKRLFWIAAGCVAFVILFVVAIRVTVNEMFRTIENSHATGLSAVDWGDRNMWRSSVSVDSVGLSVPTDRDSLVARTAELSSRSSSFDRSVESLHKIVDTHHGYFEVLRTESRSGHGRVLAAAIAVPSDQFDVTLDAVRGLGRIESISQAGEDTAVRIANAARHLNAAQTNLSRLQKLQRERKGELRDAVALEKDIAQAGEVVSEAAREQERLTSTVAQSHIRFALLEDYRAPLQVSITDSGLQMRNALVTGVAAIFSSIAMVIGASLNYGLPVLFWLALLFFPVRALRRRFIHAPVAQPSV